MGERLVRSFTGVRVIIDAIGPRGHWNSLEIDLEIAKEEAESVFLG